MKWQVLREDNDKPGTFVPFGTELECEFEEVQGWLDSIQASLPGCYAAQAIQVVLPDTPPLPDLFGPQ